MERISYKGEKVSIEIDVHKNQYTISCISKGAIICKATLPADPVKLVNYIKRRFEGAEVKSVYEAGFSGFALHRILESSEIDNIVVNAGSIEVASRDRVKTDRRDSQKMAGLLDCGRLRGIRIPSVEQELSRLLHRTREQLVRDRSRIGNRIKMRLYQFGITPPKKVTKTSLTALLEKQIFAPELKYSLENYISQWKSLDKNICEINKKLEELGELDKLYQIYKSIPGYGLLVASMLSTELGDMTQFPSERLSLIHI